MLMLSVAIFTLVAVMGAGMGIDAFKGRGSARSFALTHGGLALLGSTLVIMAALQGNAHLYLVVGLALVIIAAGLYISFKRAKGIQPRALILLHGGIAATCYGILAYYALYP
ncbi:hypothetical protein ACWJKU_00835 [Methylocaldum sp. MU1018]|jgi:hypothetical protein